jgi:hypothetical protein
MKKFISAMIVTGLFCAVSNLSWAGGILELRAGAGITSTDASSFDDKAKATIGNGLQSDDLESFHADAFLNIPVLPFGAGVRYEVANQDQSSTISGNPQKWELDVQNISLLVDWRIIDTLVYVGPLLSVGLANADFEANNAGTITKESLDGDLTYGIAAEAGIKLKKLILGAEAGYQSIKIDSPDNVNYNSDIDLSGFYGKVMVGVALF